MSTETRPRINLFAPFMQIFASGVDIGSVNETKFDEEQKESQLKADKIMDESSKPINVNGGKQNKKGGFVKKMDTNPKIADAMRKQHDAIIEKQSGEKEL